MGCFQVMVNLIWFYGVGIIKCFLLEIFCYYLTAIYNIVKQGSCNGKIYQPFIQLRSFSGYFAIIGEAEGIYQHDLVKNIGIICACHHWNRAWFTSGDDGCSMSDYIFDKIGNKLDIEIISIGKIDFFGTSAT